MSLDASFKNKDNLFDVKNLFWYIRKILDEQNFNLLIPKNCLTVMVNYKTFIEFIYWYKKYFELEINNFLKTFKDNESYGLYDFEYDLILTLLNVFLNSKKTTKIYCVSFVNFEKINLNYDEKGHNIALSVDDKYLKFASVLIHSILMNSKLKFNFLSSQIMFQKLIKSYFSMNFQLLID